MGYGRRTRTIRKLRNDWRAPVVVVLPTVLLGCAEDHTTCGRGTIAIGSLCELDSNSGAEMRDAEADSDDDGNGPRTPGASSAPDAVDLEDAATRPMLLTESTGNCPKGKPGPAMVEVAGPAGKMCIDSTEVTQRQYQEFLDASPAVEFAFSRCEGTSNFVPVPDPARNFCTLDEPFDPIAHPDAPVVCVSFCAADAFCQWAGKRLCGDANGEPLAPDSSTSNVDVGQYAATPEDSEWAYVCSSGGRNSVPYGPDPDQRRCAQDGILDVGTADCEGPPQVHDLAGNVAEWSALCNGDICAVLGGSAIDVTFHGALAVGCFQTNVSRDAQNAVGFRCCGDTEQ